jgi:predicted dehydrogenase
VTEWQALAADPEVDVLINAAPNDLHAAPSMAALRAGKAVLCEKPLARTAREAAEMARAARGSGRAAMTGFNYRFMPAVLLARRMVESGDPRPQEPLHVRDQRRARHGRVELGAPQRAARLPRRRRGPRAADVLVTERSHPYGGRW